MKKSRRRPAAPGPRPPQHAHSAPATAGPGRQASSAGSSAASAAVTVPGRPRRNWFRGLLAAVLLLVAVLGVYAWLHFIQLADAITETRNAYRHRDWNGVQHWGEQWVQASPGDTEAWLMLTEASRQREDWERMVQCLHHIPPQHPQYLGLMLSSGDQLIDFARNVELAEQIFLRVLVVDPVNRQAFQRLTFLYSMTLQRTKMMTLLRMALERRCEPPEAYFYLLAGPDLRFSNGLIEVLGWQERTPEYEPLVAARALYIFHSRKTDATFLFASTRLLYRDPQILLSTLERYPDNFELRVALIDYFIEQGDTARARESIALLPTVENDSRYWRLRGWQRDAEGEYEQAADWLQKAIEINPLDWVSRNQLAAALRSLGEHEAAAEHARLALVGKTLEEEFKQGESGRDVDRQFLQRLLAYATECDDVLLATRMRENFTESK